MYGFRTTNDNFLLTTDGGTVGSTVMTMSDASRNNDLRTALQVRNNAWSSDTTMHDIIVIHMCSTRCYLMQVMVRKITEEDQSTDYQVGDFEMKMLRQYKLDWLHAADTKL